MNEFVEFNDTTRENNQTANEWKKPKEGKVNYRSEQRWQTNQWEALLTNVEMILWATFGLTLCG